MKKKTFLFNKKIFLSIIFIFLAVFSVNLFNFNSHGDLISTNSQLIIEITNIKELSANDNFELIRIDEEINANSLIKKLTDNYENDDEIKSTVSKYLNHPKASFAISTSLTYENLLSICNELDYNLITTNNGYEIYGKYQLKRLLVMGELNEYYGASNFYSINDNFTCLCFETEEETKLAYEQLQLNNDLIVCIDSITTVSDAETTTSYKTWGAEAINLKTYNDYILKNGNSKEIVVAVMDTGINTSHEIFTGRILTNSNGKYVGYSAFTSTYTYSGYDFEDDQWGYDANKNYIPLGHGSHVSGTISELTPNNVKILPMKVFRTDGYGTTTEIFDALNEIINNYSNTYNIACVNMSLGTDPKSVNATDANNLNSLYSETFETLKSKNILPIVAAGNNDETDTSLVAPGGCDNAIVVSALAEEGSSYAFAHFSNCGKSVDITAPGMYIYSASIGNSNSSSPKSYLTLSGTSQATPHVSAAVALLALDETYYVDGKHDATTIETRLLENTTTTDNLLTTGMTAYGLKNDTIDFETYYGHGMLSFKIFKGGVGYTVSDTIATYDGKYHNINLQVDSSITDATITYGLDPVNRTLSSEAVKSNERFINCNGTISIYFLISAESYSNTKGAASLTINPVDLTIKLSNQTSTYGNSISLDPTDYSVVSGTYVSGDDLKLELTTDATSSSPVGNYDIEGTSDNENYNLTINNGSLSITPRPVKIIIGDQSGTYGDAPNLNHSLFTTDESTPLPSFDSKANLGITLATTATELSNVGNYQIKYSSHSNSNYSITYTAGTYTVTAREVILKIDNQSGTYGDNHQANLNKTAYSLSNCKDLNDISIALSTTATSLSSVGDYSISATFSSLSGNHVLTEENTINGTFTVSKKEITITTSLSGNYGNEHKATTLTDYEFVGEGFVNGDTPTLTASTSAKRLDPIGEYAIIISCSNPNYNVLTNSKYLVTARPVEITVSLSVTYGEAIDLSKATISLNEGFTLAQDSDDLGLILTHNAGEKPVANSYLITLTENTNENYSVALTSGTLVVDPKEISLNVSNLTKTYGDELTQSSFTITSKNLVYSDTISDLNATIKLIDSNNNPITISNRINVGSYTATVNSLGNSNYLIKTCSDGTLTINQKPVEITIGNKKITYGESVDLSTVEISLKAGYSLVDGDDLGVQLTIINPSNNVGTYSIKYSSHSNSNYSIKNSTSAYGTLTITKKEIEITISNATYTYGDEIASFEFSVKDGSLEYSDAKEDLGVQIVAFNSNDEETILSSSSTAGTYTLSLKTYNNKNYSITAEEGTILINPKGLTLTIVNISLQYGEEISSSKFTFSVSGLVNGETQDILNLQLTSTAIGQIPSAGSTHTITYSSHDNSNYEISNPTTQATLTIIKREIAVEISVLSIYGNEIDLSSPTIELTKGSIVNDDELNLALKISDSSKYNSSTDVGEYSDALTIVSYNDNYNISTHTATLKIGDRIVSIEILNQECEYGEKIEIDNSKYEISNLPSGIVATINLYIEENPKQGSDAGDYTINATHSGIPESCIVEITKGTFTITKRNISVNVPSVSIQYGDKISNSILNYSITSGSIYNDDLTISLSTGAETGNSVGEYEINATYSEATGKNNYAVTFTTGNLVIKEREIDLTIQNQESVYGNEHNSILNHSKYSSTNVIEGDNLNIVLLTYAEKLSAVGSNQTIDVNLELLNSNYAIKNLTKGKLTILVRPIQIKFNNNPSGIYGENHSEEKTLDASKYTLVGTYNILDEDISTLALTYFSNISNTTRVGEYPIEIKSSSSNYSFSTISEFSVNPKEISITIQNKTLTYGETPNVNNFEFSLDSDLVGTDTKESLNVKLKMDRTEEIYHVGTYSILLDSFSNTNYTVSANTDALLTISPKVITISIQEQTGIYGDNHQTNLDQAKWSTEADAIINEDILNVELITNATALSNAYGDYSITLEYNNDNYDVNFNPTKFTVSPRPVEIVIYQTAVYGENINLNNNQFEITNGNLIDGTNLGLNLTTTAVKFDDVNTYPISHTYLNLNYDLTVSSAELEITPRPITITIGKSESTYGDEIKLNNSNYSTTANSVVNNDNLEISLSSPANNLSNVGKYAVTGICANENYDATFINGEHTINKRQITIRLLNQTTKRWITFSISNSDYEVAEGSIVNPEDFEIEVYSDAGMLSLVGTYDLKASCDNENYDVTFIDAELKVNFSVFDFALPIVFIIVVVIIIVVIVRKKKEKDKNKELFDKWIKW